MKHRAHSVVFQRKKNHQRKIVKQHESGNSNMRKVLIRVWGIKLSFVSISPKLRRKIKTSTGESLTKCEVIGGCNKNVP